VAYLPPDISDVVQADHYESNVEVKVGAIIVRSLAA